MEVERLLIDIGTILKMVRFVPSFKTLFITNKYLSDYDKVEIATYCNDANIASKNHLWAFCSILEHIKEINVIIKNWREQTPNCDKIEKYVINSEEKPYSYDIVGSIVKTDNASEKYKMLISEINRSNFYYNGVSTIVSSRINNDNRPSMLHFFF